LALVYGELHLETEEVLHLELARCDREIAESERAVAALFAP
jgi:hypothetical protein